MIGHRRVSDTGSLWELLNLGSPAGTAWMAGAVCAQTDPEVFFPGRGDNPRMARMVCAGCPVRPECLAYAVARPDLDGIWAGTSYRQRRATRRLNAVEPVEPVEPAESIESIESDVLWRGAA